MPGWRYAPIWYVNLKLLDLFMFFSKWWRTSSTFRFMKTQLHSVRLKPHFKSSCWNTQISCCKERLRRWTSQSNLEKRQATKTWQTHKLTPCINKTWCTSSSALIIMNQEIIQRSNTVSNITKEDPQLHSNCLSRSRMPPMEINNKITRSALDQQAENLEWAIIRETQVW